MRPRLASLCAQAAALLLLVPSLVPAAPVYVWKDAQGVPHITDTPPPNATTQVRTVDAPPAEAPPPAQVVTPLPPLMPGEPPKTEVPPPEGVAVERQQLIDALDSRLQELDEAAAANQRAKRKAISQGDYYDKIRARHNLGEIQDERSQVQQQLDELKKPASPARQ